MTVTTRILCGDSREMLATLPDGSVQTCVTSPPYFGLRSYLPDGHDDKASEIGLEATVDEYVTALVDVFREVRRVLTDDGTIWLNLGDSYAANGMRGDTHSGFNERYFGKGIPVKQAETSQQIPQRRTVPSGLKPKDLIGIPWRVAFALQQDGWYLRSDIIWHKPNPMPESVTDRPTKSHEYLFLLTKAPRYYYDAAAIAEDAAQSSGGYQSRQRKGLASSASNNGDRNDGGVLVGEGAVSDVRNRRSVWTVSTQPFSEAHFATFPPKLIEPCILAGTSEKGECPACGKAWVRVVERERQRDGGSPLIAGRDITASGNTSIASLPSSQRTDASRSGMGTPSITTVGWEPSCICDAGDPVPQIVLDPFGGAGTTGLVADRLGRDSILIELNPEYAEMARRRITNDAPMFASVEIA